MGKFLLPQAELPLRFQPPQVFSGQVPGGPSGSLAICCRGVAVPLTEQAETRGLATPSVRVPFAVFQLKLNPVSMIPRAGVVQALEASLTAAGSQHWANSTGVAHVRLMQEERQTPMTAGATPSPV